MIPPPAPPDRALDRLEAIGSAMPDSDDLEFSCEQQGGQCFCGFHPERKKTAA